MNAASIERPAQARIVQPLDMSNRASLLEFTLPLRAVSVHSCTRKGGASNFVPDHFVLLRAASGPLDELQAAASGMTVGKQVPGDTSRFPRGLLSTNCDQTVEDW